MALDKTMLDCLGVCYQDTVSKLNYHLSKLGLVENPNRNICEDPKTLKHLLCDSNAVASRSFNLPSAYKYCPVLPKGALVYIYVDLELFSGFIL